MSYDIDTAKMLDVLRIGREKLSDKGTASAAKRVDPLRRQTGLPRAEIIARMLETFRAQHGLRESTLGAEEQLAADELIATKFGTQEWTAVLP